ADQASRTALEGRQYRPGTDMLALVDSPADPDPGIKRSVAGIEPRSPAHYRVFLAQQVGLGGRVGHEGGRHVAAADVLRKRRGDIAPHGFHGRIKGRGAHACGKASMPVVPIASSASSTGMPSSMRYTRLRSRVTKASRRGSSWASPPIRCTAPPAIASLRAFRPRLSSKPRG